MPQHIPAGSGVTDERTNIERPTAIDPQQLGFVPRRPVAWLGPVMLAGTAVRVALATLFGAYLDKRELQNALPSIVNDERRGGENGELWLDYVADLGDGFDATYSVAYLLAQQSLTVDGQSLPRGSAQILGGDQVYPTPSGQQYQDRFKGPYEAALPEPETEPEPGHPGEHPDEHPDDQSPTLYALPGNHDWYDGLTAFLRLFVRPEHGQIGGWRTAQSRSYFTIRLPHRWWLFAIDVEPGAYLDDPQLRYFHDVARQLRPGDRVIVCTPYPGWVEAAWSPGAYDSIDYFVRTVITPTGAATRLMLSGDLHHYARYRETGAANGTDRDTAENAGADPDRALVTCGGGGAYLYPTHRLPEQIKVPPKESLPRTASPTRAYDLAARYPTKATSRRFAAGVFRRLPTANPGFVLLLGVLHLLLMFAMVNVARRSTPGIAQRLVSLPLGVMTVLILASTVLFAMSVDRPRTARHWLFGLGHGIAQLALGAVGSWIWRTTPLYRLVWPLPELTAIVLYLPLVGLAASVVVAGYLLIASAFDVNVNELFASQAITDAKSFLRIRIAGDGALTIYPIGVDRVSHAWVANPGGAAGSPWIEPRTPLEYRLIEPPVTLR